MSAGLNASDDAPTQRGPAVHSLPPPSRLTERHFPGRHWQTEADKLHCMQSQKGARA